MKKIITINLSGRILPIEEPAFEQLRSYISTLRVFFKEEEGCEEIINDMQGRISELMYDKIKNGNACITESDIQELIALMGRPEELVEESTAGTTQQRKDSKEPIADSKHTSNDKESSPSRKLFRDDANRIIAGVAGGLAAYLGIDPAIVRALLVILAFSSFGLALFGYVLMWISLPASAVETFKGKRFYRDPDNNVLGGVAGGLAAYFDKPVKNIRLIFLSPLLLQILFSILGWTQDDVTFLLFNLSFGSLVGFSLIVYITLWVILPKAITPYQKMEMRGEKIDLASIQKQVKQGADSLKEKVNNWGKKVEAAAHELPGKAEQFASEVNQRVQEEFSGKERTIGGRIFKAVGILIKVFFAFFFGILAFSLLVALLAICFAGVVTWPYQGFLWSNNAQLVMAWAALVLFVVIPLLGFIVWLIRRIVGYQQKNVVLRYSFSSLWTLGWIMIFLLFSSLGKEFSVREQVSTSVPIAVVDPASLHLTVSQPTLFYSQRVPWIHIQGEEKGWDLTRDTLKLSAVIIEAVESPDSNYHIDLLRIATGRNSQQAIRRAEALSFLVNTKGSFTGGSAMSDTGVVVDLSSHFAIAANDKYRAQQVKLVVQVPAGKTISFDESIKEKLINGELNIRYNKRGRVKEIYWDDADFPYQSGVLYKMMPGGLLRPIDDVIPPDAL